MRSVPNILPHKDFTVTDQTETLRRIAEALERMVPPSPAPTDWLGAPAYVWDGAKARAVAHLEAPALALLRGIDAQKSVVTANVNRLAAGHAARLARPSNRRLPGAR